jgi:hypothetical protein
LAGLGLEIGIFGMVPQHVIYGRYLWNRD